MPDPHVDDKKRQKAMVYKARKDRRKGDREKTERKGKSDLQGMSEETYCYIPCSYLESFYTKIQYFGPRSDQLSFLHSINSLFGLRGPESILVLDSSQIWSLQLLPIFFFFSFLMVFRPLKKKKNTIGLTQVISQVVTQFKFQIQVITIKQSYHAKQRKDK